MVTQRISASISQRTGGQYIYHLTIFVDEQIWLDMNVGGQLHGLLTSALSHMDRRFMENHFTVRGYAGDLVLLQLRKWWTDSVVALDDFCW